MATASKITGIALMVYGFIVFADEGVSELIDNGVLLKGNAFYKSPFILGSYWGWPGSGVAASYGTLIAITGFFVMRMRTDAPDIDFFHNYVVQFFKTAFDASTIFFAWSLTWTLLLSVFQPGVMNVHFTEYLANTGITNTFVMWASAIALAMTAAIRLRGPLFGWIPPPGSSKRFVRILGISSIVAGVAIIILTLTTFNPLQVFSVAGSGTVYCSEYCEFVFKMDFIGWASGCILVIAGSVASIEQLFPREPTLW